MSPDSRKPEAWRKHRTPAQGRVGVPPGGGQHGESCSHSDTRSLCSVQLGLPGASGQAPREEPPRDSVEQKWYGLWGRQSGPIKPNLGCPLDPAFSHPGICSTYTCTGTLTVATCERRHSLDVHQQGPQEGQEGCGGILCTQLKEQNGSFTLIRKDSLYMVFSGTKTCCRIYMA